jgi:8-oxo-dGTP diphosphatase
MKPEYTQMIAVDKKFSYILLIKRSNEPGKDLLCGVGGHLEKDETPEECMRREWKEEIGSKLTSTLNLIHLKTIEDDSSINHMFGVVYPKINTNFYLDMDEGHIMWHNIESCNIMNVSNHDVAWNGVIPYMITVLKSKHNIQETPGGLNNEDMGTTA